MKFSLFILIFSSQIFASTPKKDSVMIDLLSKKETLSKQGIREIEILVGSGKKGLILRSISNLCILKNLSCEVEDSSDQIISTIKLKAVGKESDLVNLIDQI